MVLRVGWSKISDLVLKFDGQNQTETKVGWSKWTFFFKKLKPTVVT
jgi:hypothetical protein